MTDAPHATGESHAEFDARMELIARRCTGCAQLERYLDAEHMRVTDLESDRREARAERDELKTKIQAALMWLEDDEVLTNERVFRAKTLLRAPSGQVRP
jgi:hypothetical protein